MWIRKRWIDRTLFTALAVLISGSVFTATCAVIWPVHWPSWVARVASLVYLAGILLLGSAVSMFIARKW